MLDGEVNYHRVKLGDEYTETCGQQHQSGAVAANRALGAHGQGRHGTSLAFRHAGYLVPHRRFAHPICAPGMQSSSAARCSDGSVKAEMSPALRVRIAPKRLPCDEGTTREPRPRMIPDDTPARS